MAGQRHVLVVDDEENIRESLTLLLGRVYEVSAAASAAEALQVVGQQPKVDLVLVDLMMPEMDGMQLLQSLRASHPELPVIMLTASSGVRSAVEAMKHGAVDYLSKPFDVDELLKRIESSFQNEAPQYRVERPELPEREGDFGALVGKHESMERLYRSIRQVAASDITVLITGESGTGKEVVAREIHRRGNRNTGPFIALNCAAIPEALVEAELFGHERGAFPSASEKRIGQFEAAHGGTLFLDEIGELSPTVQAKILRFIETEELTPVGSNEARKIDVRIIAATNSDLEKSIESGKFRRDLFYRLNVAQIAVPPLRERKEDVPGLIEHFTERLSCIYCRTLSFEKKALETLTSYGWPGNVRELENVAESLVALCEKDCVTEEDLPHRIREHTLQEVKSQALEIGFEAAERAFETELILKALRSTNWVQTRAAEMLGISRRILKYKMDKLGIPDTPPA